MQIHNFASQRKKRGSAEWSFGCWSWAVGETGCRDTMAVLGMGSTKAQAELDANFRFLAWARRQCSHSPPKNWSCLMPVGDLVLVGMTTEGKVKKQDQKKTDRTKRSDECQAWQRGVGVSIRRPCSSSIVPVINRVRCSSYVQALPSGKSWLGIASQRPSKAVSAGPRTAPQTRREKMPPHEDGENPTQTALEIFFFHC